MINIDESMIQELLKNEVNNQIQSKLDKYFNSREFKNIVETEIRIRMNQWWNVSEISKCLLPMIQKEEYTQIMVQNISDRFFENLKEAITHDCDEYDY